MKKFILMGIVALSAIGASAQSVLAIKIQEKTGRGDYAGAEQILEKELSNINEKWEKAKLKDPAALPNNSKLAEVYYQMGNVYGMQFNPLIQKASQGQELDTLRFYSLLDKTVDSYTQSFVYDNTPDAKGKVKPKWNAMNRKQLTAMLDYYYYSGFFKSQKSDNRGACEEFRKFINMRKNPAFTPAQQDSIYQVKKKTYDQAAFNVVFLYFQDKDWDNVLATVDDAMGNPDALNDVYIIKQQAYLQQGDTATWVATLTEAVERCEKNTGFMEQLIYYYTQKNDAQSANALADRLIAKDPQSKSAWYMKGCTQLNLEQDFQAARQSFAKALEIDPDFMEANLNTAYAYMNEVRANSVGGKYKIATVKTSYTSAEKATYDREMEEIRGYYANARPYAERVRQLLPDQVRRWGPALSMIYANLGMKAEADEVDALISAANH